MCFAFADRAVVNVSQENVLPLGERPLLVRVGVHYKFSKLVVDRVEAVDGTYDVLFIGTGEAQGLQRWCEASSFIENRRRATL